jgi:hypothetical protein
MPPIQIKTGSSEDISTIERIGRGIYIFESSVPSFWVKANIKNPRFKDARIKEYEFLNPSTLNFIIRGKTIETKTKPFKVEDIISIDGYPYYILISPSFRSSGDIEKDVTRIIETRKKYEDYIQQHYPI